MDCPLFLFRRVVRGPLESLAEEALAAGRELKRLAAVMEARKLDSLPVFGSDERAVENAPVELAGLALAIRRALGEAPEGIELVFEADDEDRDTDLLPFVPCGVRRGVPAPQGVA